MKNNHNDENNENGEEPIRSNLPIPVDDDKKADDDNSENFDDFDIIEE